MEEKCREWEAKMKAELEYIGQLEVSEKKLKVIWNYELVKFQTGADVYSVWWEPALNDEMKHSSEGF